MGRKKYKANFIDLRGRWIDNQKLLLKLVVGMKNGRDWTLDLQPLLASDSNMIPKQKFKFPPDLRHANFNEFDIEKINVEYSNFSKATFYRASSSKAKFLYCTLVDTRWRRAIVENATFLNSDLHHSNFSRCNLNNTVFENCNLNNTYFRKADLKNAKFINCDLRQTNFNEVKLDNATFINNKMYGANLWSLNYDRITTDNIDISFEGNGSIVTNDLRISSIIHLLEDKKMVNIVSALKANSVVILGSDADENKMSILERIGNKANDYRLIPIIMKNIKDIEGEGFLKKAIMYSLLSKFVIIENSEPSGHILEFNKVLHLGCIVGVLQKHGKGSTLLLEENFKIFNENRLRRFYYVDQVDEQIENVYNWCTEQHKNNRSEIIDLYRNFQEL